MNASAIAVTCFTDLQEDEKKKKKWKKEKVVGQSVLFVLEKR
jgi:hypothetical protein